MKNKRPSETESWSPSRGQRTILQGEVHVWRIALDVNGEYIRAARDLLSADEIERMDRFRFDSDRRRFAIAHAGMRKILAGYLDCEAKQLMFEDGERGKPRLRDIGNAGDLNFNLSHSGEISLLAVARKISVGIDTETVNSKFASQEIARHFFSRGEMRNLLALPEEQWTEAFFTCWTRKEAYIKARGDGLSIPLNSFSVTFQPNMPAALLEVVSDPDELDRWSVYDITMNVRCKAALVAEGQGHEIYLWEWEDVGKGSVSPDPSGASKSLCDKDLLF